VVESSIVGKLVNLSGITAIARASSLAVDDDLSVKANWGWCLEVIQDVEAVSYGRSCSLGPAGSAVLGNVLVLVPGQVILAIHVSPVSNWRVFLKNVPGVGNRL